MDSLPTYNNLPWDLIVSALQGTLTPDEDLQFREWLAFSPDHQQKYNQLQQMWKEGMSDYIIYQAADEVQAWEAFQQRIGNRGIVRAPFGGRTARIKQWVPAAAVFLLAVGATWWYLSGRNAPARYETALNEQKKISLPDGSTVVINPQTQIRVARDFNKAGRTVILTAGEAHFEVAKNPERVFSVHAGPNEFRAIGTVFDVRFAPDGGAALTVTEGRVQVLISPIGENASIGGQAIVTDITGRALPLPIAHPITEIMVDAGKEVAIGATTQTVKRLEPSQMEAALAWQHGMILFEAQPLEDAIREVSRYSEVRFRIDQEQIRHLLVSGYFKVGDIEALVSSLKNNFNIQATRDGNVIVLRAVEK